MSDHLATRDVFFVKIVNPQICKTIIVYIYEECSV